MRTSRVMASVWLVLASTLPPLLGFRLALELLQAERPEPLEELSQLLEALGTRAVEASGSFAALGHETRLLEYAQMLRDRRAADIEARRDLAGVELAVADQLQDLPPPGLRERLDRRLHGQQFKLLLT